MPQNPKREREVSADDSTDHTQRKRMRADAEHEHEHEEESACVREEDEDEEEDGDEEDEEEEDEDEEDGSTPFHEACASGQLDVARAMFREDPGTASALDNDGWSALHYACRGDHLDVARFLVEEAGCDIALPAKDGVTPFLAAVDQASIALLRYLLSRDASLARVKDNDGYTALHTGCAPHATLVFLVEEEGLDVLAQANDGRAVFHQACALADLATVEYFFSRDPAVAAQRDENGYTCLWFATSSGNVDVTRFLVERAGVDVHAVSTDSETAFTQACRTGRVEIARFLFSHDRSVAAPVHGRTALHSIASLVEMNECVLTAARFLVRETGADVRARDSEHHTPFMCAANNGHVPLMQLLLAVDPAVAAEEDDDEWTTLHLAAAEGEVDALVWLVETCGLDLHKVSSTGHTPFLLACASGHVEAARRLIALDASVASVMHPVVGSALHHPAADDEPPSLDMVAFLLDEVKLDLHLANSEGHTPFMLACLQGHADLCRFLFARDPSVAAVETQGHRPVHLAVSKGRLEVVKFLVEEAKADLRAATPDGFTAFALACLEGLVEIARYLHSRDASLVRERYPQRRSCLHLVASANTANMLGMLLDEAGADPNAKDEDGDTPFALACATESLDVARELLARNPSLASPPRLARSAPANRALLLAVFNNSLDSLRFLVEEAKVDPRAELDEGLTAFQHAWANDLFGVVRYLQAVQPAPPDVIEWCGQQPAPSEMEEWLDHTQGWSPLMFAADHGCLKRVMDLLEAGDNVHVRDSLGSTAAQIAKNEPLLPWRTSSHPQVVVVLLRASEPWSPATHELWGKQFRQEVFVLMLLAKRLRLLDEVRDHIRGQLALLHRPPH